MSLSVLNASDVVKTTGFQRSVWTPPFELTQSVARTLADIRARGDAALPGHMLRIAIPMQDGARALVPPEIADGLRLAKERLSRFHERQRQADLNYVDEDGTRYGMRYRAFDSVAIHVAGGSSASAVLRAAVPARIAGVGRVIVLAQPQDDGTAHPAVVYACSLCEVDELYAFGGAPAIAAAAYGTHAIARVDMIVGDGGTDVTEAKRQIFGVCALDRIAGPPDVLVIADDGANSELVAGELLAQAERESGARVAVLSESRPLLDAVAQLLDTLDVGTLSRGDVISSVIANSAYLVHAGSRDELLAAVDVFVPSCVSLQVRDAEPYLARLRRAAAVFVGDQTPVAAGSYLAGTNSLTLSNFLCSYSVVENSRERMERDAQSLAALAEFEGLPENAQSARLRNGI